MEVFCVPTNESTVLSGVSPTTTGAPPDPITRVRWLQRDHHHRDDAPGWVLPDDAERYQGSACEALVFCGTQSGCVRSRVVPTAAAYAAWAGASLPVATAATAAVRAPDGIRALDVMCSDVDAAHDLILSASWDGVLVRRRTGAPVHSLLAADHWVEARCVCASPVSGHAMAFVTTDRGYMHMLDVLRGRSVRTTSSAPAAQRTLVACWGQPQAVVLGHDDGSVSVRDASTLAVMQREPLAVVRSTLRMPVADLAMRPDVSQALVCFGVSPLLRLYDIRVSATRSAGNVPAIVQETTVGSGDSVVAVRRVDGARHSGWLALGASGTVQRVSMAAAPEETAMVAVLDTEGDLCTCLDVSPDGRHMAVGDTGGMLHVWQLPVSSDTADGDAGMTAALEAGAVAFEREWHEALRPAAERPPPCVCVPPTAPLLSEMPLRRRRTLPGSVASDHRRWHFPERLSAEALKAARFVQSVGYLTAADAIALLLPDPQPGEEPMRWTGEELPPPLPAAPLWERLRYRKIDLARAEGVDGFDFAAHNRTPYCGLENALPSSYINAAIQMLYFVRPFRRAMEHAAARFPATPESMEVNLAAELGHLFRMMNRGAGQACQATQLMRALRGTPQAMALQLVDHPTETGASALAVSVGAGGARRARHLGGGRAVRRRRADGVQGEGCGCGRRGGDYVIVVHRRATLVASPLGTDTGAAQELAPGRAGTSSSGRPVAAAGAVVQLRRGCRAGGASATNARVGGDRSGTAAVRTGGGHRGGGGQRRGGGCVAGGVHSSEYGGGVGGRTGERLVLFQRLYDHAHARRGRGDPLPRFALAAGDPGVSGATVEEHCRRVATTAAAAAAAAQSRGGLCPASAGRRPSAAVAQRQ
eukprot:ctg_1773.g466